MVESIGWARRDGGDGERGGGVTRLCLINEVHAIFSNVKGVGVGGGGL